MAKSVWMTTLAIVVLATAQSPAQPLVNGTLLGDESFYGSALSIQNTDTHFGDAQNGDPQFALQGSEIDQVFGTIANDRLYLLVTGNLESNFNKLSIFFDSKPGGVNQIDGSQLPVAVDAFCCGGFGTTDGALQRMNGMTFDAGFAADHFLTFANGVEHVGDGGITEFWALSAHYANLTNGPTGQVSRSGIQLNPHGLEPGLAQGEILDQHNNGWDGPDDPTGFPPEHEFVEPVSPLDPQNLRNHRDMANDIGLQFAIDNSNFLGVVLATQSPWLTQGNPADVVTGIEFSIPLAQLGSPAPGTSVRIAAFINGDGHHYASNQFAGDGVLQGNLGGDGQGGFTGSLSGVNLANIDGNQFVTLMVPGTLITGDFNNDGLYNCADIDALVGVIATGSNVPAYDLTGDGLVNTVDRDAWLAEAGEVNLGPGRAYRMGDANLDGVVDGSDFGVWNSSKFTNTPAWCAGDFTADGVVDGSDFGSWNSNKFTSSDSASAVPEPAGLAAIVALGVVWAVLPSRRR